jgi:hypothetical protein
VITAPLERVVAFNKGLFDDWNPHGRSKEELGAAEVRRGDADDGELILVDADGLADYARIGVEMAVPVGIAEHDVGSAVFSMLVDSVIEAAEVGLNPQFIEVIAGREVRPGGRSGSAHIHADGADDVEVDQAVEGAVLVAQIDVVEIGLGGRLEALDHVKTVRMRQLNRMQDNGIQNAEDDGIGANTERERQDRGHCEAWRLAQFAQSYGEVAGHSGRLRSDVRRLAGAGSRIANPAQE